MLEEKVYDLAGLKQLALRQAAMRGSLAEMPKYKPTRRYGSWLEEAGWGDSHRFHGIQLETALLERLSAQWKRTGEQSWHSYVGQRNLVSILKMLGEDITKEVKQAIEAEAARRADVAERSARATILLKLAETIAAVRKHAEAAKAREAHLGNLEAEYYELRAEWGDCGLTNLGAILPLEEARIRGEAHELVHNLA